VYFSKRIFYDAKVVFFGAQPKGFLVGMVPAIRYIFFFILP